MEIIQVHRPGTRVLLVGGADIEAIILSVDVGFGGHVRYEVAWFDAGGNRIVDTLPAELVERLDEQGDMRIGFI